jgi:hypothetical protein
MRRAAQQGQETLQAVLAGAFILLPLFLGMLELGDLLRVVGGEQAAAAAGARVAGIDGQDDLRVQERIHDALVAAGLDPSRVQVMVSPSRVGWGDPITVRLTSRRRLSIPFLFTRDVVLSAASVAQGEVDH